MLNNILIRNVKLFDAEKGTFGVPMDILVNKGIVAQIAKNIPVLPGYEVVEEEKLCASTGWTDCHIHLEGFDPFLSYPSLGLTRIHDAGSFGAANFCKFHDLAQKLPYQATTYLYVGYWGITSKELQDLAYLDEGAFLETAKEYPDEILGAKIRIDPRVNCDTKKSLRIAKEFAVKAGLPLIVHPSRCGDTIEEVLAVMDKDDVFAHTYSPVCPNIFDEKGRIKKAVWDAVDRGVRFDLSHGSNNFEYDLARRAIAQGLVVETISTDLHERNFTRPVMDLAGVITKAIHVGIPLEAALQKVIINPSILLHTEKPSPTIQVGQRADITIFMVKEGKEPLIDSMKNEEVCEIVVEDVATVIGASLHRSIPHAIFGPAYWAKQEEK